MSHVKSMTSHRGQADPVMSHYCAEVIHTTMRDSASSMDTVSSIDSVSSNQVICGGHRTVVSDRGIHKDKFKVEIQQSENTDSLQVKCVEQHISVKVEWGNMVHYCVFCHSIKAEIEKLVCILNNGSLELIDGHLEPSTSYCIPSEFTHSTQTAHPGGTDHGGVDTPHPRGVDQGGVDTSHPRGIDQGEADSGCAFFQDTKADIKTLISSDRIRNVNSATLKEIGNLQPTDTKAAVGICPVLNIKQECGGELCNMEGTGDRGYWHDDVTIPLEVPPVAESMGPVTSFLSPSLLSVELRGQPLKIPSTERPLAADKHPSHKPSLPGKTLHIMLCNRGAQCYHNQPQDHLNKGIKTVKGCDDLRVQGQPHTGVQNNQTVGELGGKGTQEGGQGISYGGKGTPEGGTGTPEVSKGTPEGGSIYQLNMNSFIGNSNAEVIGFEVRAKEAHTDKDSVFSKGDVSGKGFTSTRVLVPHQSVPHQLKPLQRRKHIGEKPYKCSICGKGFYQKCNLKQHSKAHTLDKPFKYDVCGKRFTRKIHLKEHDNSHRGEKSSELVVLGKKASKKCSRNLHQKQHTGSGKQFECSVCSKKFSQKYYLSLHHRIHTGEKPFECITCGKRFTWKVSLRDHERAHTGEQRFPCEVCNKKFSTRAHLLRHQRTHTGEKPFECMVCHKKFSDPSNLKIHQWTHTDEKSFECMVCGKKFSRPSAQKRHGRTHTREKPFECMVCGKQFSRQEHLMRHRMIHTGEKPFECMVCGKQFSRPEHLMRHQKTHTA